MDEVGQDRRALLVECATLVLRPIVRFLLTCGLNCKEFLDVARIVYVRVATEHYGIRGRPTNVSRVSALTGLSRRVVRNIRELPAETLWSPDSEITPLNSIIHYWRYDPRFSVGEGMPRALPLAGKGSFGELAEEYVSGIPAVALRKELIRLGIARMTAVDRIQLEQFYAYPSRLDEDFLRNWAFSLGGLAGTLSHNASLVAGNNATSDSHTAGGRFEQVAWSRRLSGDAAREFQKWTRAAGHEFVQEADRWIARHESTESGPNLVDQNVAGVGVYFFLNEPGAASEP